MSTRHTGRPPRFTLNPRENSLKSPNQDPDTASASDARAPSHPGPTPCHDGPVQTTLTILCSEADDPDQFEATTLDERRERSGGWKTFSLRSRRMVDTFLLKATCSDFGVFDSAELPVDDAGVAVKTCVIMRSSIRQVVACLETMVERRPTETALALINHGGTADLGLVTAALTSGAWPTSGDPAEETAAFAFQLLVYARYALEDLRGVCWEFRGDVAL